MKNEISFRVVNLDAAVADGISVEWQGRELTSGPLISELDPESKSGFGSLDYSQCRARAEFRVVMKFPELARTLQDLGADEEFSKPLRAVIRSEGPILEDHSFVLSGDASVVPHALFDDRARASVLPGT